MNKMNFNLIAIVVIALLSCQSNKKKEIVDSSKDGENAIQKRIENNIYEIDENGKNDSLATTIELRMKALNVPGLSITVFDNNEILWSKGYGKKNKKTGEVVNENTVFQAASISKPIASVAVFKLIEKDKFSLNEDVNSKLKRWQVPNNEFTQNEKVTPSRIMSHTSGLSTPGFHGYNKKDSIPSLKEILQGNKITNSEPVRVVQKPGESELYSGGGMEVLQMLMEDVSGEEFPQQEIQGQPCYLHTLYDLMDAAYDSPIIIQHSKSLGHVPIIDINPRKKHLECFFTQALMDEGKYQG